MRLVVLDRDGVINEDSPDYIKSPAEWQPIPGSLAAIAKLTRAGIKVVVVTNQSGLARGLFDHATLQAIHTKMNAAVRAAGGRLSGLYFCPHGPDEDCPCRKPRAGMLRDVMRDLGCSMSGVPVIGDSARDLAAAAEVGARPILVLTGKGRETLAQLRAPVECYPDLAQAVESLLREEAANEG